MTSAIEGTVAEGRFRIEQLSACERAIHLTLNAAALRKPMELEFRRLQQRFRLKGFRPGKVPLTLVRQRCEAEVVQEQTMQLVQRMYPRVIEQSGLSPVEQARPDEPVYTPGKDVTCLLRVQVQPEIQLADWRGLKLELPTYTVSEEQVEAALQRLRRGQAVHVPIAPREHIQKGDFVWCDITGTVDGKSIDPFWFDELPLCVGKILSPSELNKTLVGRRVDESFSCSVTLAPDAHPHLRGKQATLSVRVQDVKMEKLPELDDEFAKDVSDNIQSLQQLKQEITRSLTQEKEERERRDRIDAAKTALNKLHPFELPPALVAKQFEALSRHLNQMGGGPLAEHLKQFGHAREKLNRDLNQTA
ncbi:MAG: trigger factor, partial [Myxococcota bacterium]